MRVRKTITWRLFFFELFVIILGISISYFANEWRLDQKERKEEKQLLSELRSNLVKDTISIQNEIKFLKEITRMADSIIRHEDLTPIQDSLGIYLLAQMNYAGSNFNDLTYKELKQTGKSAIISNRDLLKDIISLYEREYWLIKEYHSTDKSTVANRLIPKIESTLPDFRKPGDFRVRKLENSLLNMLVTGYSIKGQTIIYLKATLQKCVHLIEEIDKELGHSNT